MIADDLPAVNPNVDLTKILPIQQKRMIAFANHFIMNWVSYLNTFAQSCESQFMQFEYKLQKVEASLLILESQLSSISGLEASQNNSTKTATNSVNSNTNDQVSESADLPDMPSTTETVVEPAQVEQQEIIGIKASEDPKYKRFFTMLKVGVPLPAVQLKMKTEGVDPDILNNPDNIISKN